MPINLETLQIQFQIKDNTGNKIKEIEKKLANFDQPEIDIDTSKAKSTVKQLQKDVDGIHDGKVSVTADIKKATTKIGEVQDSVSGLQGKEVGISAYGREAITEIETISDKIEAIPNAPKIKPEVDTSSAESGLNNLWNLMKTMGLVSAGKELFEFGMSSVNMANEGKSIENRIRMLGENESEKNYAMDRISEFSQAMNEKYGLNESGLSGMIVNFASAYKGMGQSLETAIDSGINAAMNAIDYASALDKTPGEIADLFMSVLKGQTEVADSAGIYGLTVDKMNQRIDERMGITALENLEERTEAEEEQLKALKKQRDDNIKLLQAEEFLRIVNETASASGLGYAGDFERTAYEFGNQRTILSEQLKSFQQNIGELLTPAATEGIGKVNELLGKLNELTQALGKSSFANDVNGYFGTMTVDTNTMQASIDHVTEPLSQMTIAVTNANAALDEATQKLSSSYQTFVKTLTVSGADGDFSENAEEIENSADNLMDNAVDAVESGRERMMEGLNAFTGGMLENETSAMIGIVDSYFNQAIARVKKRQEEFQKALEEFQSDSTPENLAQLKQTALSMTQEAYSLSAGYMGADEYSWLKSNYQAGRLSAETLEQWLTGMAGASAAEQEKVDQELESYRRDFIAMGQQVVNPETGRNYTISELDALFAQETGQYVQAQTMEANKRRYDMIAELMLSEYSEAAKGIYSKMQSGEIDSKTALGRLNDLETQIVNSGLIEAIMGFDDQSPAMMGILALTQLIGTGAETAYSAPWLKDHEASDVYDLMDQALLSYLEQGLFPDAGSYLNIPALKQNGAESALDFADDMSNVSAEFANAVHEFGAKNLNISLIIGGYEFGAAVQSSLNEYNTVNGSG